MLTVEGSARRLMSLWRLNKSIDRRDWPARDFWAEVVHAIHDDHERSGESPMRGAPNSPAADEVLFREPSAADRPIEKQRRN